MSLAQIVRFHQWSRDSRAPNTPDSCVEPVDPGRTTTEASTGADFSRDDGNLDRT